MSHTTLISQVQSLLKDATLETTPTSAAKVEDFRHHVPEGTTIFVTFLPGSDFADTLQVVKRLKAEGMHPVTHLAARSIKDADTLNRMLDGLAALDAAREVLIIGGGVDHPVGDFHDTVQMLHTDLLQQHGVEKIGIAGHPEGSPDISQDAIKQALRDKIKYAQAHGLEMYITTQFCFEVAPIVAWHDTIKDWGNCLPIHIGVPGPATIKTLLRFAQLSGIGNSMRFISKQAANVTKLLRQQAPDQLVLGLARYKTENPDCAISHCHLYPFAGFAKTAHWLRQAQQGKIHLNNAQNGFDIVE